MNFVFLKVRASKSLNFITQAVLKLDYRKSRQVVDSASSYVLFIEILEVLSIFIKLAILLACLINLIVKPYLFSCSISPNNLRKDVYFNL